MRRFFHACRFESKAERKELEKAQPSRITSFDVPGSRAHPVQPAEPSPPQHNLRKTQQRDSFVHTSLLLNQHRRSDQNQPQHSPHAPPPRSSNSSSRHGARTGRTSRTNRARNLSIGELGSTPGGDFLVRRGGFGGVHEGREGGSEGVSAVGAEGCWGDGGEEGREG